MAEESSIQKRIAVVSMDGSKESEAALDCECLINLCD
jgi:hypothetical protein